MIVLSEPLTNDGFCLIYRSEPLPVMHFEEISELDGENPIWEIPASRTKNKLPHIVPLTL